MTKLQMIELHKLSVKDKIKVVQTLWDDIANEQSLDTLPADHKKLLDERIQKINTGKAIFK
jgi:putative addiction module component (TIGR02574 family)